MNMHDKLVVMNTGEGREVFVFSAKYGSDWIVTAEGQHDGVAYKISETTSDLGEAVNTVFNKWSKLVERVPELRPALSAPTQADDEIPF